MTNLTDNPDFGQAVITQTGTAMPLSATSKPATNGVSVFNHGDSDIVVGRSNVRPESDGTGNGDVLEPGQGHGYAVRDASRLWINGTAGGWVSYSVS